MAAEVNGGGWFELPGWMTTLVVSAMGLLGGFLVAIINRSPALQAVVDARLRTLIDGYEKRVDDLTSEVESLRREVISLRKALSEATGKQTPAAPFGL